MTPTAHDIQHAVAKRFGIEAASLTGNSRRAVFARPRQVAYALCARMTSLTYTDIGRYFGGRDHSTIYKGIESFRRRNSCKEMQAFHDLGTQDWVRVRFSPKLDGAFHPSSSHTAIIKQNKGNS